jgi:hypothetical protein
MDDWCRPALQPSERKTGYVLARVNLMMAGIVGGKQGQA